MQPLRPFFPPFLSVQKGGPRPAPAGAFRSATERSEALGAEMIGERDWRSQKVKPRNEALRNRSPAGRRISLAQPKGETQERALRQPKRTPRTLASVLSKTSHRDVFDGQPVRPPGTGPSGFSAPNGCPPFVTKRPAAPRPGCRPRHGAQGFLLSFSIAKRKKQRKMLPPVKHFAPCGERPKAPPLETATLWKGWTETLPAFGPAGLDSRQPLSPSEGLRPIRAE